MEILTGELRAIPGVAVGHWTDRDAQTGCTVIRFDAPALTAAEVRGAAPGTRELDLLRPGMTVQRADAILLTGGSAFGLAAADGVMRWLHEHGRGFTTAAGPVPIVPAANIFDLATGEAIAPTAASGHAAVSQAVPLDRLETGRVGAGTGATVGNIAGVDSVIAGRLLAAQVALPEGTVTAIVVLNAYGLPSTAPNDPRHTVLGAATAEAPFGQATTLLACITDIPLDHGALQRMTVAMHDGLARAIMPVHTVADGDVAFATTLHEHARPSGEQVLRASLAAELAVEAAIGTLGTAT